MLTDKIALVTGGSRGIGRAICLDLAAHGALVAVNYYRNAEAAAETVRLIADAGGTAAAFQADVADFTAAQQLIDGVIAQFGRLDILVNNAGITDDSLLPRMDEAQWDAVIDTNLKSVFNCCRAAVRPLMRQKTGGRIINVSSIAGVMGTPAQTNYSASKAGIHGFTRALAKEVGPRQVTVNAVAPGLIPTDLTAAISTQAQEWVLRNAPLRRLGRPEEVAAAVTFLASDRAAYITGTILRVDGGLTS